MAPAKTSADGAVNGNGSVIGVQTLISTAVVLFMAFGGGWTLFQSQLAGTQKQIEDVKQFNEFRLNQQQGQITALQQTVRDDLASVLIPRKEFVEFQARYESLVAEVVRLQQEQHANVLAAARRPVEKETLDVIDADFSKRIDQIEVQIQDINRQIAAALIIIDNQNQKTPTRPALPPDK
jgi:hypothetical protein